MSRVNSTRSNFCVPQSDKICWIGLGFAVRCIWRDLYNLRFVQHMQQLIWCSGLEHLGIDSWQTACESPSNIKPKSHGIDSEGHETGFGAVAVFGGDLNNAQCIPFRLKPIRWKVWVWRSTQALMMQVK